jgi:hypothetical protein
MVRIRRIMHKTHVIIPDTQAKPGVPTVHLRWIMQYIVDHFVGQDVTIIHLGDHADMPSLSSYDKGKKSMEGRRYIEDIAAANEAFDILNFPLEAYNAEQSVKRKKQWWPRRVITLGNHEDRISRAIEADAQLDGLLSLDALNYTKHGWEVVPFLKPIVIDGVSYAHYFYNPMTGKPYGGAVLNRLKTLGFSFTMGHQQTLEWTSRTVRDGVQHGLVAGACYLHDEEYKGWQGNAHFRGIVVCHEVEKGNYDPMFVSLNYLCMRYEGMTLAEYKEVNHV